MLGEAAEALSFRGSLPRFLSFLDQEEDFIDATLFRAVEWFDIRAFEPWLSTGAAEFSSLVQHGIDHTQDGWDFFHWCRSNLAISMSDSFGLESWLWTLSTGRHDRAKMAAGFRGLLRVL